MSAAVERMPVVYFLFLMCALTLHAAPLPSGYVSFDDTGLGYPSFSVVNLTGDPACDSFSGFVCEPYAFEDGVLEIQRNGVTTDYLLQGPLEPQSSTTIEDNGWDFQGFQSAVFRALLAPRFAGDVPAVSVIAILQPSGGADWLVPGDLALIESTSQIPEPGSVWMMLSGCAVLAAWRQVRRVSGRGSAGNCARQ